MNQQNEGNSNNVIKKIEELRNESRENNKK